MRNSDFSLDKMQQQALYNSKPLVQPYSLQKGATND